MKLLPRWSRKKESKAQGKSEEEESSNHIYAMFEHSKPSPRLSKLKSGDCASHQQSPRVTWKEEGLLPTISVRISEGVRAALDALDADEASLCSEGLWRECGDTNEIKQLAQAFAEYGVESKTFIVSTLKKYHIHSVTGAIKAVLRNHQPVTTYTRSQSFVQILLDSTDGQKKDKIQQVLQDVPAINRQLLGRLVTHFANVVSRKPYNKMSFENLGIALGPTLFRCCEHLETDLIKAREDALATAKATARLLEILAPAKISKRTSKDLSLPPEQDENREAAVNRCVRLRLTDLHLKDETPAQLEASITSELEFFGKITRLGLKPNITASQDVQAVVLFDSSDAAMTALRTGHSPSWSIEPIAAATPQAKQAAAAASCFSSLKTDRSPVTTNPPTAKRDGPQRIKRAFTTSNSLIENVTPSARTKPLAYSMNDLGLAFEESALEKELFFSQKKALVVGSAHW